MCFSVNGVAPCLDMKAPTKTSIGIRLNSFNNNVINLNKEEIKLSGGAFSRAYSQCIDCAGEYISAFSFERLINHLATGFCAHTGKRVLYRGKSGSKGG